MGRISQADGTYKGGKNSYNETYTFDNDNRILEKTFASGMKYSFNYESTDHAIRSIDISGSPDNETRVDFNYNDFGNMTKKTLVKNECTSITEFKYDETNKLVEIDLPDSNKKLEFKYDNGGQRIVKEFRDNVGIINKNVYVNGFYEIVNDAINKHISDGQYIFATKLDNDDDNLIYYSQNNIGSTTLLTNKDGSDIGEFLYTPFGEMWVEEASTVDISNITRFFTNQQYDKESGLYYYNARYYDPHLGSFITPDPAMDQFNHYVYCAANPITYNDPTGLKQNWFQKRMTSFLSFVSKISPISKNYIKQNTSIKVQRNPLDSGNNGKYYKSEYSVKSFGIKLNNVPVQSTADHPRLNQKGGKTLPEGKYKGNLVGKSRSYMKPIQLEKEGVTGKFSLYLFHPNEYTTEEKATGEPYAKDGKPYGRGCQIESSVEDHDETVGILESVGFEYGGTDEHWQIGDSINVEIKDAKIKNVSGQNSNNSSSNNSNSSDSGTVICTELFRQGILDKTTYKADKEFGTLLISKRPNVIYGYHFIAKPIVKIMKRSPSFTKMISLIALSWAKEMSYRMNYRQKGNIIGKIIMFLGIPLCGSIGFILNHQYQLNFIFYLIFGILLLALIIFKYYKMYNKKAK